MVKFILVVRASLAIAMRATCTENAQVHVYICLFHFKFEEAFDHCTEKGRNSKPLLMSISTIASRIRMRVTDFRTNAHNQSRNEYNKLTPFIPSHAFHAFDVRIFKSTVSPFLHVMRKFLLV